MEPYWEKPPHRHYTYVLTELLGVRVLVSRVFSDVTIVEMSYHLWHISAVFL